LKSAEWVNIRRRARYHEMSAGSVATRNVSALHADHVVWDESRREDETLCGESARDERTRAIGATEAPPGDQNFDREIGRVHTRLETACPM
jgi:hypothetical protein